MVKSIPALDQAAVACVAGWTFEPAVKDGRSVATVARAPVTFRIFGGPPPGSPSSMWDGKDGRELLVTGLDSKGAGIGEWLVQFEAEVFGHWELPEPLRSGPRRVVALELAIAKDGSVSKVRRVLPDTPMGPRERREHLYKQARAFADSHDDVNFTPLLLSTITARTLLVSGDRDYLLSMALEMRLQHEP